MHRITAIVLCILAQGAFAQCVAPAATNAANIVPVSEPVLAVGNHATPHPQPAHPAQGLIKTAAAGTRDDAPPVAHEGARKQEGQDHPRRGGTAMLLAALALMSGIALRRYGAPRT